MKTSTPLWASLALYTPFALAQGLRQATGGAPAPTSTTTSTAPTSTCTASLLTTLCDYPAPAPGTAVAASSKETCWEYCNAHQPCAFVVFARGNPTTGSGTCWLYPGEAFDASKGSTGCDYLDVYDKPVCEGDASPTSGACAATATPSAVAEVCGYPEPEDKCFSSCAASEGAAECLSQCAESDCAYAIFYTGEDGGSQYGSGTCWRYPDGTFDKSKAGTCTGKTEQYVYENKCPKKAVASVSGATSASASASSSTSTSAAETGTAGSDAAKTDAANQGKDSTGESGATGSRLNGALVMCAGLFGLLWRVM